MHWASATFFLFSLCLLMAKCLIMVAFWTWFTWHHRKIEGIRENNLCMMWCARGVRKWIENADWIEKLKKRSAWLMNMVCGRYLGVSFKHIYSPLISYPFLFNFPNFHQALFKILWLPLFYFFSFSFCIYRFYLFLV